MIETLENNEQILLMYLAHELPQEDRREVEQMLQADASLSRELAKLQLAEGLVMSGLGRLDEMSPLPVSAEVAARRAGREIRLALARPKIVPAARSTDRSARRWGWLYPTVAAASVAIIAMVWLGHAAGPPDRGTVAIRPGLPSMNQDAGEGNPNSQPSRVADSADSDDSLLIQSLQQPAAGSGPDEVAVADSGPQDEISQYLLNAGATQAGSNR